MTIGRLPQIIFSPNDNLGSSSPGARLSFYEAGSTTNFKAIFSDFASTPLENPVLADGVGRFPNIVLDDATSGYNVKFETSDGATIPVYTQQWFEDNVSFAGSDPLLLGDGTAADPTYSFASEPSTGIFLAGSGLLSASVLGNEVVQWTSQGLNIATSGESATPSLIMENDIDTGWRQDGNNNWTFSASGEDQLALSLGLMSLPGPAAANNIFTLGSKLGRASIAQFQGVDITQPMTDEAEASTYFQFKANSATIGGAKLTGLTDGDSEAFVIEGFIGSAAPSTSTPAIQLRTGKSDGGTGLADLAPTELAFSITDSDGTTDLFKVLGNGDVSIIGGDISVSTLAASTSLQVGPTAPELDAEINTIGNDSATFAIRTAAGSVAASQLWLIKGANVSGHGWVFESDSSNDLILTRIVGGGTAMVLSIENTTGDVTINSLAGTGSRTVVADANGKISAP